MSNPLKQHKAVTIWVTWTLAIVTFAVWQAFRHPEAITAQTVAALTIVVGLPPTFVALWKWIRSRG
jgi:hypothetical protein